MAEAFAQNTEQISRPCRTLSIIASDGTEFRVRVHGNRAGPRIFLSHGNGFATNAYWPFWRHLEPYFELVVFDFRNHGENGFHGPSGHDWATFTADFDAILTGVTAQLGLRPSVGLFHSMSAVTALLHLDRFGWPWDALVLIEPPVLPPPQHPLHDEARAGEVAIQAWALQREQSFANPAALADRWSRKRAFKGWEAGTHLVVADSILRHNQHGGSWMLRCPRELEAKIYDENRHSHLWSRLAEMPCPMLIYAGDPAREAGAITAQVAIALATENGKKLAVQRGAAHLPMLEDSAGCAQTILNYLGEIGIRP